jgi:hypothetical protein
MSITKNSAVGQICKENPYQAVGTRPSSTDLVEAGADELSILEHTHNRLTKLWQADGTIKQYDDAAQFKLRRAKVCGIKELSALLLKLEKNPHACLIRGRYVGDDLASARQGQEFQKGRVRRRKTGFDDQPLHTILIEIDGKSFTPSCDPVEEPEKAIEELILAKLPPNFHYIDFHWQLSSSAGAPKYAGKLKAHVWFWLARPCTSRELKTWAELIDLEAGEDIDASVFDSIQAHFTATPVFEAGVVDPVPVRSGYYEGIIGDEVYLDIGPLLREHERKLEMERAERIARSPSGDGLIDWFNAKHSIEDVMVDVGYLTEDHKHWRSPLQSTGSFATMIFEDGLRWVSKSGSDAAAGIGMESKGGARTGDAFDIYRFFKHDNDRRAALRAVAAMRQEAEGAGDFEDVSCSHDEEDTGKVETPKRRGLVQMDQFIDELPTPDFIIDDVMQRGWLYSMTAPTGHGKTAVALEMALRVATGTPLGEAGCDQGSVVYLAGENADDVRARCLMAVEREMDRFSEHKQLPIWFLDRVIRVEENIDWLFKEVEKIGGASMVVVDTAAAYFAGDDDNNNVEMGDYARMLRRLCAANGRPAVLVLSHPVKNPSKGNLLPRGGGAFLNEVDGNLRLWSEQRGVTELHWCGKFRGKEFEPVTFKLEEAKSSRYVDSKGRRMSSVIASVMSAAEVEQASAKHLDLSKRVLQSFLTHPAASFDERCRLLGMVSDKGTAKKGSLSKIIERHVEAKFLEKEEFGTVYKLTNRGKEALRNAASHPETEPAHPDLSASEGVNGRTEAI